MTRVWIESVLEQPTAAVTLRLRQPEIATAFRQPLTQVWNYLRLHPDLRQGGHNLFLYRDKDAGDLMTVEIGVQVSRAFEGDGEVICSGTPAGMVATALHVGAYERLVETHARVQDWCRQQGHLTAGIDWETYGDWNDDPAKLETRVSYLLR